MKKESMQSTLKIVRGLGSAREGTSHFIGQRVTALVMIPLTLWFITSLIRIALSPEIHIVHHWLASGINASLLVFLLVALFYHAKLGVQVIIEDYIHCSCLKIAALLANFLAMSGLGLVSVLAVIKIHLIHLV